MIKKILKIFLKTLILFFGGVAIFLFVNGTIPNPFFSKKPIAIVMSEVKQVEIEGAVFDVDLAINEESRVHGLSGRGYLGVNHGILFVFDTPAAHFFWMKGVKMPLDIIWIDEKKQIMDMVEDVKPDSYPVQFGTNEDSLYVLEFPAGTAKKYNFAFKSDVVFLK
jgi:hypothetical protein